MMNGNWIFEESLTAITDMRPELKCWANVKRQDGKDISTLDALIFICCSLDPENRAIVANHFNLTDYEMQAFTSVISKTSGVNKL